MSTVFDSTVLKFLKLLGGKLELDGGFVVLAAELNVQFGQVFGSLADQGSVLKRRGEDIFGESGELAGIFAGCLKVDADLSSCGGR